jgi:hypothetical protein
MQTEELSMTLFLSRKRLVQVCILIVVIGFPSASFSKTVGVSVITEVNGKVSVEKKQWKKSQPALIGLTLNSDDKLDLPANASVEVFCSNGQTWIFKSGKHTVSSGCPSGNSVIRLPNSNNDTLRPVGTTEEALSRLPYLITPRQTYILTNRPRLRWNTVPGVTKYTVKIDGVNWEMKTSDSEIVYPGEFPLEEGRRYRITVEAGDSSSSLSDRVVGFNLLDKQTKKLILDAVQSVQRQSSSSEAKELVLAYLYRGYGLYSDAIERLEGLVSQGSQKVLAYQLLGDSYLEIGLPQLAKKPYEQALELSTMDNLSTQARIQEGLGKTYRLLGNEGAAVLWLKKAKAGYELLGDTLQVQELEKTLK